MLTNCPECGLQISDKAVFCPHCGYPLKPGKISARPKRKRLPNGFGQISEIKNKNLRKPFRAMVCMGHEKDGRPIIKPLRPEAYFETYNDAYTALIEYHRNPYRLEDEITLQEVYDKWLESTSHINRSSNTVLGYKRAWEAMSKYHSMRVRELRKYHIRECAESVTYSTAMFVKRLFSNLLQYAADNDVIDTNFAKGLTVRTDSDEHKEAKTPHITYTDEELEVLWKNISAKGVRALLLQCYTGMRPGEVLDVRRDNVHVDERYMIGGMKTKAGKDRIIPIHSRMVPIVETLLEEAKNLSSEYLVNIMLPGHGGPKRLTTVHLDIHFARLMKKLEMDPKHRPHDGRVCFATRAKLAGIDEYAIKLIMGHTITDLTERVYTKRPVEHLVSEIEKLK